MLSSGMGERPISDETVDLYGLPRVDRDIREVDNIRGRTSYDIPFPKTQAPFSNPSFCEDGVDLSTHGGTGADRYSLGRR